MAKRQVLTQRMAHYRGASKTPRADWRLNKSDAIEAARADRQPIALATRDMVRNNPRAQRIRRQLCNQVVGAGIMPAMRAVADSGLSEDELNTVKSLFQRHCMTTDIDADGLLSLFGLQGLAFGTVVTDGEVLLRRRFRRSSDGFALPFQIQILETDYLDPVVDGDLANGNYAVQGIEFNKLGRRVAYHLFPEHPGGRRTFSIQSKRVAAENVLHIFRVDRPGQQRGVSWLAPIMTKLHELDKYQDGQIKRQEVASLFAAVLKGEEDSSDLEGDLNGLKAGAILRIGNNEDMDFSDPPKVDGYEPFMRATDRVIAAGMGMTYEGLSGDYSGVNYTSGRMGRMDVDPNVRDWQDNLAIAQMCVPLAAWISEAVEDATAIDAAAWETGWSAPVRPVVDPTKDHKADETAMRSGKKSRRQVIRETGRDPDEVERELLEERRWEADNSVVLTSNAGSGSAAAQSSEDTGDEDDDDNA